MKKILLGGAAAFAALSLATVANAQVTDGFVGVQYTDFEGADIYGLNGTAAFQLAPMVQAQVDGNITGFDVSGYNSTIWGPTAHLFYDTDSFDGGAFVGYEDLNGPHVWGYGLEGRAALSDNVTLGGIIGQADVDYGSGSVKFQSYSAQLSVFATDNFRIDGSLGVIDGAGGNITVFGLGGEYKLDASPLSFIASYTRAEISGSNGDAFTVGARWTFGGSLKHRDRNSAPFGDVLTNLGGGANGGGALVLGTLSFIDE